MSKIIRTVPGSLPAFLRGSLFAACVALAPWLAAQDDLLNDFSKRPEIEKRLAAVRSEISALPADADAALRERLQQLEALCRFHLSATDLRYMIDNAFQEAGIVIASPLTADIDASFSDIFDQLEMAAALQFEARNGRWGIIADGFYADLSGAGNSRGPLYDEV